MKSVSELENIRKTIDKLSKFHHIEILKILKHNNVVLNENNYGTFVNMSELENYIIDKIMHYIEYTEHQEIHLKTIESEKGRLKYKFFEKQNKQSNEEVLNYT